MIVTENHLDEWVRGHQREAQGVVVELVLRLVATSCPRPRDRRFPLGDSIGQHGPDGLLITDVGFAPFVPDGRSFWEIGAGIGAAAKATKAYRDLTAATPEAVRRESTFVFVTPLSGRRDWESSWKEDAQLNWLEKRREQKEWQDIKLIDGTRLVEWVHQWFGVEQWIATKTGLPGYQMQTVEQRWAELTTIGHPPPLIPEVFIANREEACAKLKEFFSGATLQLKLDTRFPRHVADFAAAYVATMDEDTRLDTVGRCLVIPNTEAWVVGHQCVDFAASCSNSAKLHG